MNWKSHLFISIILFLIFSYFLKINLLSLSIIPLAIAVLVFSLLPDIDHSKSKISIWFRLSYTVLGLYSREKEFNYYSIYSVAGAVFRKDYYLKLKHEETPHFFNIHHIVLVPNI